MLFYKKGDWGQVRINDLSKCFRVRNPNAFFNPKRETGEAALHLKHRDSCMCKTVFIKFMKTFRKPLAALLLTTKNAYGMKRLNCFIMKATAYLGHGQSYLLHEVDWCYRAMSRKILSSLWHDTYANCPSSVAFVHNLGNGLQDPEVHLWYTLRVNSLSLCVYLCSLKFAMFILIWMLFYIDINKELEMLRTVI